MPPSATLHLKHSEKSEHCELLHRLVGVSINIGPF
jgi:hypothetical protein